MCPQMALQRVRRGVVARGAVRGPRGARARRARARARLRLRVCGHVSRGTPSGLCIHLSPHPLSSTFSYIPFGSLLFTHTFYVTFHRYFCSKVHRGLRASVLMFRHLTDAANPATNHPSISTEHSSQIFTYYNILPFTMTLNSVFS